MVAALAHGRAVVTTPGPLTESFWQSSNAVILASPGDLPSIAAALAADPDMRERMGAEARALYDSCFDLRHTIAALRGAPANVEVECESRS